MATSGRPGVFTSEYFAPLAVGNNPIPGEALPAIACAHPRGPLGPQLITSWGQFVRLYGDFTQSPGSLLPFAVSQFFTANGGSQLFVLRLPNSDAAYGSLDLQDVNSDDEGSTGAVTVTALTPGVWAQNIFIEITACTNSGSRVSSNFNVYLGSVLVETWQDVSMNPVDSRYLAAIVNSGSNYIRVTDNINQTPVLAGGDAYTLGSSDLVPVSPSPLTGGSDGSTPPVIATVVPQWLDTLTNQVLVVNVPGLSNVTTLNSLIAWAADRGDKFIVIDGPQPNLATIGGLGYSTSVVAEYAQMVASGSPVLTASSYAAVYAPWLLVKDPSSAAPGATRWLPPGPSVLAVYNTNDSANGVFDTPAGTTAQINAIGLETNFAQVDLDNLNDMQVNAIKVVPGAGYCIFGGRTLSIGYPDRYISIRRMIMQLEHDFENILQGFLFQPNDYLLWRYISTALTNYLIQQMQIGALAGSAPNSAYQVVCDDTNNTPSLIAAGIVTADVAVALNSPAEFININLSQFQGTTTATTTT
jgi:hypothetical protein